MTLTRSVVVPCGSLASARMRATVPPRTGSGPIRCRASWTRVSGLSERAIQVRRRRREGKYERRSGTGFRSGGLDVEGMRDARLPVHVPGDVDLIVAPVGPNTPSAQEPPPEAQAALLDELAVEDQPPGGDAVVVAELLAHAVHVDRERLPHAWGEGHPRLRHGRGEYAAAASTLQRPCPRRIASAAPTAPAACGSAWTATARSRSCYRAAPPSAMP